MLVSLRLLPGDPRGTSSLDCAGTSKEQLGQTSSSISPVPLGRVNGPSGLVGGLWDGDEERPGVSSKTLELTLP